MMMAFYVPSFYVGTDSSYAGNPFVFRTTLSGINGDHIGTAAFVFDHQNGSIDLSKLADALTETADAMRRLAKQFDEAKD